jgi:hypothetical protein
VFELPRTKSVSDEGPAATTFQLGSASATVVEMPEQYPAVRRSPPAAKAHEDCIVLVVASTLATWLSSP